VRQDRDSRKRKVEQMLELLKTGTVIVEGKHDTKTLSMLGIRAIPYERIISMKESPDPNDTIYIMVDNDKGGDQKSDKIVDALLTIDKRYTINSDVSKRLLKMLNLTSVEQMLGPIEEIRENEKGGYYGKNLSRDSKVHG
jgi:5S rRNA maturation endonuclease (ribonuclease M5)